MIALFMLLVIAYAIEQWHISEVQSSKRLRGVDSKIEVTKLRPF